MLAWEEIGTQKCESFGAESRKIENGKSDKRLVAYVVRRKDAPITTGDLRRFLKNKLPEYMLPSVFVFMEVLPLNHNGKVDRDALPAPSQSRPDLEVPFAIARTPIEEVLADTGPRF